MLVLSIAVNWEQKIFWLVGVFIYV